MSGMVNQKTHELMRRNFIGQIKDLQNKLEQAKATNELEAEKRKLLAASLEASYVELDVMRYNLSKAESLAKLRKIDTIVAAALAVGIAILWKVTT